MSTRANVLIKDQHDSLWFYRHSDGYPEGTLPTLADFMGRAKRGEIRRNVGQAAGWLIVIGQDEYADCNDYTPWKVGAYEPTTQQHGDIEWLYTLDLATMTIDVASVGYGDPKPVHKKTIKGFSATTIRRVCKSIYSR